MERLRLTDFISPGLDPLNLVVEAASCTTLAGPSGCGKTRLLRAIADLDPAPGGISLNGTARDQYPPMEWHRLVGYLPAESHWWGERVGEHFNPEQSDTLVELLHRLDFAPEVLDWSVSRLSSGERQRLALARQLILQPLLLLLDEPTANLDRHNGERIEALLLESMQQHETALLWVSHDRSQRARVGDRQLQFSQGRLEADSWN